MPGTIGRFVNHSLHERGDVSGPGRANQATISRHIPFIRSVVPEPALEPQAPSVGDNQSVLDEHEADDAIENVVLSHTESSCDNFAAKRMDECRGELPRGKRCGLGRWNPTGGAEGFIDR